MLQTVRRKRESRTALRNGIKDALSRVVDGSLRAADVVAIISVIIASLTLLALIPDTFFRTLSFAPPPLLTLELYETPGRDDTYPMISRQRARITALSTQPFHFPERCQQEKCALLLRGVDQAVTTDLDGETLSTIGPFPRSISNPGEFPSMISLPTQVSARDSHQINLMVLQRPAFVPSESFYQASIVFEKHAASYVRANTVRLAFMPTASSLGLLFIAAIVTINLARSNRSRNFALVLVGHCLLTAMAHYLFSDVACEKMGMRATSSTILICRRLGDLTFFLLALWSLKFSGKVRRLNLVTFGTFSILTAAYCTFLAFTAMTSHDSLAFVHQAAVLNENTEWLKFVPLVACLSGCLLSVRQARYLPLCVVFLCLLTLTFCHEVNVFGFPYRTYLGKLHGFVVGAVFLAVYLRDRAEASAQHRIRSASNAATASQARQVAHDIRSPLAALRVLSENDNGLEGSSRELLSASVERLTAIAGLLLAQDPPGHEDAADAVKDSQEPATFPGAATVSGLVTEKNLEFARLPNISITFIVEPGASTVFLHGSVVDFQRVVSNLMNNAVEALGDSGEVDVRLKRDGKFAVVCVADNGRGIPKSILKNLGRVGATFNKRDGNGLGLAHAFDFAARSDGHVDIDSTEGVGTEVALKLPARPTPDWFVEKLRVCKRSPFYQAARCCSGAVSGRSEGASRPHKLFA